MNSEGRDRFLNNVCIIEIENNSKCNRRCDYCINSHIYRKKENEILHENAFKRLIDELADLNYSRLITFHRYNEPFWSQNEMILSRIRYARKRLPNATLIASTNGDYLDSEYLNRIANAGLDELYIQYHVDNFKEFSIKEKMEMLSSINLKVGCFRGKFIIQDTSIVFVAVKSPFKKLTIQMHDFINDGFDRGGILKSQNEEITGACWGPLSTLTVDYNGSVMICCNCVSYYEPHMKYIIGNIYNSKIVDIYNSSLARKYQFDFVEGKREKMCNHCTLNYEKYKKMYEVTYI